MTGVFGNKLPELMSQRECYMWLQDALKGYGNEVKALLIMLVIMLVLNFYVTYKLRKVKQQCKKMLKE